MLKAAHWFFRHTAPSRTLSPCRRMPLTTIHPTTNLCTKKSAPTTYNLLAVVCLCVLLTVITAQPDFGYDSPKVRARKAIEPTMIV